MYTTLATVRIDVRLTKLELLQKIDRLRGEPVTLEELAANAEISRSTVIRHLKQLKHEKLITSTARRGRARACYRLTETALDILRTRKNDA